MSPERRIRVLPPQLASQIAAGEVVERPASVVKELIENALDAEATRVDVEIEAGGIARLAVLDDGVGMSEDDAKLSVERHATSKLRELGDLNRLVSYGFRGEALPSIASVSRLSLRTRAADAEGVEVLVEGGGAPLLRPHGMPVGTRVEVNDLFFNVPARRKFLRSTGTESGHVTEIVEAAALSQPQITFTLTRDGRPVREFLRSSGRQERVQQICPEIELCACRGERGPLTIEAFLSRPELGRTGAGGLTLLVNGRPVRDRALAVTVAHSYGSVLERGRYPRGVVFLDLPAELVDVNVHPQKAEVRFADPRAVSDALYGVLSRELATAFSLPMPTRAAFARAHSGSGSAPPTTGLVSRRPEASVAAPPTVSAGPAAVAALAVSGATALHADGDADAIRPIFDLPRAPIEPDDDARPLVEPPLIAVRDSAASPIHPRAELAWASLRFVAQLRQMYLLCEGDDGLYLLDQHAAAERVTFTRLRREYQSRAVPSQSLLFPITLEVSAAEAELVEQRAKDIAEVGLEVRVRGPESISIHAVPKLLQRASPERLLRDLLSEVSRRGGRAFSDAVDLALATMACHGSVRAGDPLAPGEVKALLEALDDADFAGHCPHGRPIVTSLSWAELERKVGRR